MLETFWFIPIFVLSLSVFGLFYVEMQNAIIHPSFDNYQKNVVIKKLFSAQTEYLTGQSAEKIYRLQNMWTNDRCSVWVRSGIWWWSVLTVPMGHD